MRLVIALIAAAGCLAFYGFTAHAADTDQGQATTVSGILIDQACGSKMMSKDNPEQAAASHPKACAMKDACANSGFAVISGKEMVKFDDNGNKLAKEFLAKTDKADHLYVTVEGTRKGDQIAVTAIKPAAAQ